MTPETFLLSLRLTAMAALLIFSLAGLAYGLRLYAKLKGEFGQGVHWITYGHTFIVAAVIIAFPIIGFIPDTSPLRLIGEASLGALFVGAFAMTIIGYKKIYDLVSQIA